MPGLPQAPEVARVSPVCISLARGSHGAAPGFEGAGQWDPLSGGGAGKLVTSTDELHTGQRLFQSKQLHLFSEGVSLPVIECDHLVDCCATTCKLRDVFNAPVKRENTFQRQK